MLNEKTQMGNGLSVKTQFDIIDYDEAYKNIMRARYLRDWSGCLKLETNGKEIILSQFPDGNSWTKGYEELFRLNDYQTIDDFECFHVREDGKVEIEGGDEKGEYYESVEITSKEDAVERLIVATEEQIENISEEIDYMLEKQKDDSG